MRNQLKNAPEHRSLSIEHTSQFGAAPHSSPSRAAPPHSPPGAATQRSSPTTAPRNPAPPCRNCRHPPPRDACRRRSAVVSHSTVRRPPPVVSHSTAMKSSGDDEAAVFVRGECGDCKVCARWIERLEEEMEASDTGGCDMFVRGLRRVRGRRRRRER